MKLSDQQAAAKAHHDDGLGVSIQVRRPASWLDEAELRRRARRRSTIYWMVAAGCMLLFVLLIYLLIERTRWSAGSSTQTSAAHIVY